MQTYTMATFAMGNERKEGEWNGQKVYGKAVRQIL